MKFLINEREYADFVCQYYFLKKITRIVGVAEPNWKKVNKIKILINSCLQPSAIPGLTLRPQTPSDKQLILDFITKTASDDLEKWQQETIKNLLSHLKKLQQKVNKNFRQLPLAKQQEIYQLYNNSRQPTQTRQLSKGWEGNVAFSPRARTEITDPDTLFIRNSSSNENLLRFRMENNLPFFFMDSGYTNFLETHKKWHRVCKNNTHISNFQGNFNTKRLNMFPMLPTPWRNGGDQIVIIEPSETQCQLYNIDLDAWSSNISRMLEAHLTTSKKIIFRQKIKTEKFYHYAHNNDIYCVIHYNSNAGVEAIWNGIPCITLGNHITQLVSRQSINDINNLIYPDLDNWLKRLSYSQFTYEEISNGTAQSILENKIYV